MSKETRPRADAADGAPEVRTVLSMVVREGCERRFEEEWRTAAAGIARFPGNLTQTLARDRGHERRYVIISDWAGADALESFEPSPERKALSAVLETLRESAEKSVLEVVTRIDAEGRLP